MSDLIVRMGSNHGITAGKYVDLSQESTLQIIDQTREEIGKLPKTHKTIFSMAAGTAFMDALLSGQTVHAATSLGGAFEPVKSILLDIADPLCYIMFVWGCIECMVGRPASGLNRMKYAALGYMAINWIPVLMDIIRSSGPGA